NLDREGPTLDPAEFAKPLHESGDPLVLNRSRHRARGPDGRQPRRLLRARRGWPRDGAAEQRNELAALHVGPCPSLQEGPPSNRRVSVAHSACYRADGQVLEADLKFSAQPVIVLNRGGPPHDPTLRAQAGSPRKRTSNLRAWNTSYRRSLRIQRKRGVSQKKDRTIACLICAGCVK